MRMVTDEPDFTGAYWEKHYREPEHDSHQSMPNPHLVGVAELLSPGTALDAGCGEGGDAIFLSRLGWRVTGVDISASAVEKTRAAAAAAGVQLELRCVDLTLAPPEHDAYDLVTAHHVHTTDDQAFVRALGSAVKPGGVLLVVGHEPRGEHEVDPHSPGSHSTAAQVASYLDADAWDVEAAEVRVSEGTSPDGASFEDKDSVFLARKRPGGTSAASSQEGAAPARRPVI
jgi:SAM-dependent methyltransferase